MKTNELDRVVSNDNVIVVIHNEPVVKKPTAEEEKNFVTRVGSRIGRIR